MPMLGSGDAAREDATGLVGVTMGPVDNIPSSSDLCDTQPQILLKCQKTTNLEELHTRKKERKSENLST